MKLFILIVFVLVPAPFMAYLLSMKPVSLEAVQDCATLWMIYATAVVIIGILQEVLPEAFDADEDTDNLL